MRKRFGATLEAAARCELVTWRESAEGRLAEIPVLAQELVGGGHDQRLTPKQRAFAYMPTMHSESLPIHA